MFPSSLSKSSEGSGERLLLTISVAILSILALAHKTFPRSSAGIFGEQEKFGGMYVLPDGCQIKSSCC